MQLIDNEVLIWDDIKGQYSDEWVVIGNPCLLRTIPKTIEN